MDQERFRKELEAKTAAHEGDVLAAVSEMLGEVIENLESLPTEYQEIVKARELLGVEPVDDSDETPAEEGGTRERPEPS
jgi:hypothetical protein